MVAAYYTIDFAAKVQAPPWDLASNLPRMAQQQQQQQASRRAGTEAGEASTVVVLDTSDPGTWAPAFFQLVLDSADTNAPWMGDALYGFFKFQRGNATSADEFTVGNLVHDSLVCSFDNVMFCGRQNAQTNVRERRNLLVCLLVSVGSWMLVGTLASFVPVVGRAVQVLVFAGMVVLVPMTTVYLTYGMAATCFPLVPTCLVQDIILSMQATFPIQIAWPQSLQKEEGCMDRLVNSSSVHRQQECMRSCREAPFNFRR